MMILQIRSKTNRFLFLRFILTVYGFILYFRLHTALLDIHVLKWKIKLNPNQFFVSRPPTSLYTPDENKSFKTVSNQWSKYKEPRTDFLRGK